MASPHILACINATGGGTHMCQESQKNSEDCALFCIFVPRHLTVIVFFAEDNFVKKDSCLDVQCIMFITSSF